MCRARRASALLCHQGPCGCTSAPAMCRCLLACLPTPYACTQHRSNTHVHHRACFCRSAHTPLSMRLTPMQVWHVAWPADGADGIQRHLTNALNTDMQAYAIGIEGPRWVSTLKTKWTLDVAGASPRRGARAGARAQAEAQPAAEQAGYEMLHSGRDLREQLLHVAQDMATR